MITQDMGYKTQVLGEWRGRTARFGRLRITMESGSRSLQPDRGAATEASGGRMPGMVRIIGARFATKREQALYRSHLDRFE
jgi:hypothetical protein